MKERKFEADMKKKRKLEQKMEKMLKICKDVIDIYIDFNKHCNNFSVFANFVVKKFHFNILMALINLILYIL